MVGLLLHLRAGRLREQTPAMIDWIGVDMTEPIADDEEWRPTLDLPEDYEVSNYGRVRSIWHASGPRILAPTVGTDGHLALNLGRHFRRKVHRLVLEAFIGSCPEGLECRHLDGNPTNNHIFNLVWGTKIENRNDRTLHGNGTQGMSSNLVKLTDDQVQEIRASNLGRNVLAEQYNISPSTVYKIRHRKTWRHLP